MRGPVRRLRKEDEGTAIDGNGAFRLRWREPDDVALTTRSLPNWVAAELREHDGLDLPDAEPGDPIPVGAFSVVCNSSGCSGTHNSGFDAEQTGPGFVTRPGGPGPTITLSLRGIEFEFFLGGLMGLEPILINTLQTTVTGEDLANDMKKEQHSV